MALLVTNHRVEFQDGGTRAETWKKDDGTITSDLDELINTEGYTLLAGMIVNDTFDPPRHITTRFYLRK